MINENQAKKFCCEDISLIENYNEAVKSKEMYDIHHRLGTELSKSRQELKDLNLYLNRPANELIFLTRKEHVILHMTSERINKLKETLKNPNIRKHRSDRMKGKNNPFYGKHHTEDVKIKMRKPKRKYKWLTPSGEIKKMTKANVHRWHPDWTIIGEV